MKQNNKNSKEQICSNPERNEWIKDEKKTVLKRALTRCLQKVSDYWDDNDSDNLLTEIEKFVYPVIDTQKLFLEDMKINGGSFDLHISQNVVSDELFDLILEYYPEKWQIIRNVFMNDGLVDLVYEDRYVNSPLGCILLAQFIRRIRDLFRLQFKSITVCLSSKDFKVIFNDDTLKIYRKFSYVENRDNFLKRCMDKIVKEPYDFQVRNVKHSRTLSIYQKQSI